MWMNRFGAAFGQDGVCISVIIYGRSLALAVGIIILMFGIGSGIEKANKIMMPIFFALFRDSGNLCRIPAGEQVKDTVIFSE